MQLVAMRNNPNHKRNQIQACLQISDGLNNTFCFLIGDLRSRSDPVLLIRQGQMYQNRCTLLNSGNWISRFDQCGFEGRNWLRN